MAVAAFEIVVLDELVITDELQDVTPVKNVFTRAVKFAEFDEVI